MKYDLTIEDAVWLACAIDGEGSVSLNQYANGCSQQVCTTNTKDEFLDKAEDIICKLTIIPIRSKTAVTVNKREDLLILIPQILPYLVIKSKIETAKKVIEHCKISLQLEDEKIREYKELFELIKSNPNITIPEMQNKLSWFTRNRDNKLYFLRHKGYIQGVVNLENMRHTQFIAIKSTFNELDFLNVKRERRHNEV